MGARTGQDYLDHLQAHPREVWLRGERIEDVSTHSAFESARSQIARLYDLQHLSLIHIYTILDRLDRSEREALLPHLHVFDEEESNVIRTRGQPIEAVYFPIDAVYSVVVELSQGHTYEVDVIGRGGVVGAELAIGAHRALRTVLCQAGGRVAQLRCV